jgi:hypothetical protein
MTRPDSALSGLEDARKKFVEAIDGVPTEALTYLSPGDDYALGGLVTHINGVLRRYGRVLDGILADPAAELDAKSIDEDMAKDNARSKQGLTAANRDEAMATLAALHDHVTRALSTLSPEDLDRKTSVRYGDGETFPTSATDIRRWLMGHYMEHVPHVEELLRLWRGAKQATSR